MLDGVCWGRLTPELATRETESGFSLITPTKFDRLVVSFKASSMYRPTHLDGNLKEQLMQRHRRWLTPNVSEILMMWPDGWSDLPPLETVKYQQWLHSHGALLGDL